MEFSNGIVSDIECRVDWVYKGLGFQRRTQTKIVRAGQQKIMDNMDLMNNMDCRGRKKE